MLTLTRPEGALHVDITGSGPLLILAPGMGDLRSAWRHLVPGLVAAGYRVAAMDLRGHGASDATFSSYTPEDVADDVIALIEALGTQPAVLVGHSAAAASAVKAAADRPELVRALVLVGPVARDPAGMNGVMKLLMRWMFLPFWGAWAWGAFYRTLFKGGTPADHEAHVARVVANLREAPRRRAMLEVGMSSKAGCEARAGAVGVPVLALLGERDPDYDVPKEAAWIADALRATVHVFPGVGHDPHMEVPEATLGQMLPFLAGLPPVVEASWRAE